MWLYIGFGVVTAYAIATLSVATFQWSVSLACLRTNLAYAWHKPTNSRFLGQENRSTLCFRRQHPHRTWCNKCGAGRLHNRSGTFWRCVDMYGEKLTFAKPLPLLWRLRTTNFQKAILTGIFSCAGFVGIISIIRLVVLSRLENVDVTCKPSSVQVSTVPVLMSR